MSCVKYINCKGCIYISVEDLSSVNKCNFRQSKYVKEEKSQIQKVSKLPNQNHNIDIQQLTKAMEINHGIILYYIIFIYRYQS